MENLNESAPELDLDSAPPPAEISPSAYVSTGVDAESETAAFTVTSDVSLGGAVNDGGVIASIDDRGGLLIGGGELVKKKRGRPRKYDSDVNGRRVTSRAPSQQGRLTISGTAASFYEVGSSTERGRGGPKFDAFASLGGLLATTSGGGFTPHVVIVHTGVDVAATILAFAQKGCQGICVLSANGCVSNVTLRQPGSYGGLLTHEGLFEILTLTGSFTTSENHGLKSRNGGLSVSLAGSDGSVIGGVVAGSLMAATPVQIVLASFMTAGLTTRKRKINDELPKLSPHKAPTPSFNVLNGTAPSSYGPKEGGTASQFQVQSHGETKNCFGSENEPKSESNDAGGGWDCSPSGFDQIPYPDINLSVTVDEQ